MMENEEKEDLLVEVTESEEETCEKEDEDIDYYIRDKILDFIRNEREKPKTDRRTALVVVSLLIFLSSSTLVVLLPVYVKNSTSNEVTTYGKLVAVSAGNLGLFALVHLVRLIPKWDCQSSPRQPFAFLDVLKVSLLLSAGNACIFALLDGHYIRCHLEDPLKGCSVVFSLLFYYVLSKKKMSIERIFCAITIIVGVFVSVDFGICDKFRCNGVSKVTETTPKLHFLYVLLYLFCHGVWVLHFTLIEVCWTVTKDSGSILNPSILSKAFGNNTSQAQNLKQSIQSLSIICQEDGGEFGDSGCKVEGSHVQLGVSRNQSKCPSESRIPGFGKSGDFTLGNPLACFSRLSTLCAARRFPMTSTPKSDAKAFQSWSSVRFYDVALWQHFICCLVIVSFCWLETLPLLNEGKEKLLVDVIGDVIHSLRCHLGLNYNGSNSSEGLNVDDSKLLLALTLALTLCYVTLILSSLELLKMTQSTVTIISLMMPALPVSSLFWSLFRINDTSSDVLEFNPEITGEAVCAVLGLPIIGIGIVLLLKSHVREFNMAV